MNWWPFRRLNHSNKPKLPHHNAIATGDFHIQLSPAWQIVVNGQHARAQTGQEDTLIVSSYRLSGITDDDFDIARSDLQRQIHHQMLDAIDDDELSSDGSIQAIYQDQHTLLEKLASEDNQQQEFFNLYCITGPQQGLLITYDGPSQYQHRINELEHALQQIRWHSNT